MAQEDAWRSWYPNCLWDLTGWCQGFFGLCRQLSSSLWSALKPALGRGEQEGTPTAGSPTPHGTENTIKQPNTALSITQCSVTADHHSPLVRWVGTWPLGRWERQKDRADVQSVQVVSVWTDGPVLYQLGNNWISPWMNNRPVDNSTNSDRVGAPSSDVLTTSPGSLF